MMRLTILTVAAVLAVCLGVPTAAHHSHGNYALSDFTSLEGTVSEVHWINPHSWIFLEVPDADGEDPALWALEATNPAGLARNGIGRNFVLPGDPIRVRCHRLKDGADGCLLGFVTPLHGDAARGHGIEMEWD